MGLCSIFNIQTTEVLQWRLSYVRKPIQRMKGILFSFIWTDKHSMSNYGSLNLHEPEMRNTHLTLVW